MRRLRHPAAVTVVLAALTAIGGITLAAGLDWNPKPLKSDVLVRMPGSQHDQGVVIEASDRCLNCHGGYDKAVEPGFNWQGSMMAQAARDPIFWACLTVAAQDAIWALGNPNATDLCIRCHFPAGWLGKRSEPTNASLMAGADYDGVSCDFCHRLYDPFAKTTHAGTREGNDWKGYWDERANTGPGSKTLSQTEANRTLAADLAEQTTIKLFSGQPFFVSGLPKYATYTENTSGPFFAAVPSAKRATFADSTARHKVLYSRHHKSRYFCATCHDVSNAALANLMKPLPDQSGGKDAISEQYAAGRFFHVERTWSEFTLSAYGKLGGAATNADFRSQGAPTIARAATCQDCHMRDVKGKGANKKDAPVRSTQSAEHPKSGLPLHDMTGGNVWISHILASLDPSGPVYDAKNAALLGQGPGKLTLDLTAGLTPVTHGAELKAGSDRALAQLKLAATVKELAYRPSTGKLTFVVQNNTGHKLISGFPEGRRMFVNVRAYRADNTLLHEVNPYDDTAGTMRGLPGVKSSPPLRAGEAYVDGLVYEAQMTSSLTKETKTFHVVLATGRYKDNRIPPKGFDLANAAARLCEPVAGGKSAPGLYTAAENAAGHDRVEVQIAKGAARVEVRVFYQGTSREYVEFLRDEINGTGGTLPAAAYIAQKDAFFSKLKAWGTTMWELWRHNHGLDGSKVKVPGIVPVEMARGEIRAPLPYLGHTGTASPGSTIKIVAEGKVGDPVTWALSFTPTTYDPPVPIPGLGALYLKWPFTLIPLGAIPASGRLEFPLALPAALPRPSVWPTQALVGTALTNLDVIAVE